MYQRQTEQTGYKANHTWREARIECARYTNIDHWDYYPMSLPSLLTSVSSSLLSRIYIVLNIIRKVIVVMILIIICDHHRRRCHPLSHRHRWPTLPCTSTVRGHVCLGGQHWSLPVPRETGNYNLERPVLFHHSETLNLIISLTGLSRASENVHTNERRNRSKSN